MSHTTTVVNKIERRKILINHKVIIVITVDKLCNPVLIRLDVIETVNTIVDQKNHVILFRYNRNDVRCMVKHRPEN